MSYDPRQFDTYVLSCVVHRALCAQQRQVSVADVALNGSCRALRSRHRMYKPQRDVALNRLRHSPSGGVDRRP